MTLQKGDSLFWSFPHWIITIFFSLGAEDIYLKALYMLDKCSNIEPLGGHVLKSVYY